MNLKTGKLLIALLYKFNAMALCLFFIIASSCSAIAQPRLDSTLDLINNATAQNQFKPSAFFLQNADSTKTATFSATPVVNKKKIIAVSTIALTTLVGSYIYANNAWWKKSKDTTFHFDHGSNLLNGPDSKYAKNLDKAAHFYGGVIYSDLFSHALLSANVPVKKAKLFGAILGSTVQAFIEVKDGFSPTWGFSIGDVAAGTLGSFYTWAQSYVPFFAATDIKFSYYKRDDYYFKQYQEAAWNDDYMNMTFWATYNPARLIEKGKMLHPKWPKWLGISTGLGVDNTLNNYYLGVNNPANKGKGKYELYIAPDIDFTGFFPKSKMWQKVAKVLNHIKFPLPTLRFAPKARFYGLFF